MVIHGISGNPHILKPWLDMWNCHGASWVLLCFFGSGKFGAGWVTTFRKIWQFLAGCIINGWIFWIKSRTNTGNHGFYCLNLGVNP